MEKHRARGLDYRVDGKHLPAELLQKMCLPSIRVWPSVIVEQDNTDIKHPALLVQNLITDRTPQSAGAGIRASNFNRCNDATVRTREVPLVCVSHATSLLYHVHAVASRNKWFTSCGMRGKLTLWTSIVFIKF